MKLNFAIFKKGKPIFWVIGAIVLFVIFYLIASRGAGSSSSGTTVVNSGPSDAQVAMNGQIAIAQLQANAASSQYTSELAAIDKAAQRDIALGGLSANVELASIGAERDINLLGIEKQYLTDMAGINAQKELYEMQSEYALEGARVASEAAFKSKALDASVLMYQLDTNRQMFETQTEALVKQSQLSIIPTLKKKDRDNALIALSTGNPNKYAPQLYGVAPSLGQYY